MQRKLAILLEIQGMELRLRELDADLAAVPKRVAAIEAKLSGAQQNLARAQAAQSGSQSERRQVDREIEALREKITKIRGHSGDVKTNQEYRALLDEIAFAEAQIAKHEERLLEIMEQADALDGAAKEAAAALERQRGEVRAESEAAQTHSAAVQAERATLAQSRDRLRTDADDTWLRRFDRVLRMRGQALAAVDREACSGCRVRLRPQFLQEMAQQDDRLFVCESCGRILYLETSGVDVSSC